jgi:site-specific DNA-methyltransferase (adenine-specific)
MKPFYQDSLCTIYHGDCREILPMLPKVDLVLTDPPYGIRAAKSGAHSSIRDSSIWSNAEWDNQRPLKAVEMAIRHAPKAMIWGGNYYTDILPPSPSWLAWIKPEAGTGFSLADMELCWTNLGFSARTLNSNRRDGHCHPTQKPLAVMLWCLSFSPTAKTILDSFMGSGTTLVASKQLGRKSIGIELEEKYCEIAAKRLQQEYLTIQSCVEKPMITPELLLT